MSKKKKYCLVRENEAKVRTKPMRQYLTRFKLLDMIFEYEEKYTRVGSAWNYNVTAIKIIKRYSDEGKTRIKTAVGRATKNILKEEKQMNSYFTVLKDDKLNEKSKNVFLHFSVFRPPAFPTFSRS